MTIAIFYLKSESKKNIFLAFFFYDVIFGGHDVLCKSFANEMKTKWIFGSKQLNKSFHNYSKHVSSEVND